MAQTAAVRYIYAGLGPTYANHSLQLNQLFKRIDPSEHCDDSSQLRILVTYVDLVTINVWHKQ